MDMENIENEINNIIYYIKENLIQKYKYTDAQVEEGEDAIENVVYQRVREELNHLGRFENFEEFVIKSPSWDKAIERQKEKEEEKKMLEIFDANEKLFIETLNELNEKNVDSYTWDIFERLYENEKEINKDNIIKMYKEIKL
jgi:hypothetical protein